MALLSAILLIGQVGMSYLPNIEIVSLLIYIYTQVYRKKVFLIIYVFVILEGCIYGFGLWWFGYLYIWSILALIVLLNKKQQTSVITTSAILGAYGLSFYPPSPTFWRADGQPASPTGYPESPSTYSTAGGILRSH